MESDLEKYLAAAEERARGASSAGSGDNWMTKSQADVPRLVAMLRKFCIRHPRPKHEFCTCGPCVHYTQLDRFAREGTEEKQKETKSDNQAYLDLES